jgi:hypothetical protein
MRKASMGYFEVRKAGADRHNNLGEGVRIPDIVNEYYYCNRCGTFRATAYRIPGIDPYYYKIEYLETGYRWNTDALGLKCTKCGYARTYGEWKCSNPNGFAEKNLPANAVEGFEASHLPEEQEIQRLNREVREAERQVERKCLFLLLAAQVISIVGLVAIVTLILIATYAFFYR